MHSDLLVQICDTLSLNVASGQRWKQEITERVGIAAYRILPHAVFNWEGKGESNRQ